MSKRTQGRLLVVIGALISALLLAACGDDDNSTDDNSGGGDAPDVAFVDSPESDVPAELPEPKQEDLTIGLLNPLRATEVLTVMFDASKEQVDELGGTAVELDAQFDPDRQVSQFQQLVNQDVDAIAFVPIAAPQLLAPVMKQAAQKGIPVIGMDALPGVPGPLPGFATDIWQQRDRMVYLEIKAAADELGEGAQVGQIGLAAPVPLFEFAEARTEHWAKKFGLEIVDKAESANDTVEGGQEAAAGLLTRNPDIEGIIGYNDEPAIGAASAARAAGRDDLKTFGACCGLSLARSGIESGRLTATVVFDAAAYGRQAVIAAYNAVQGAKLPPEVLAGELVILTADNLDEFQD